MRTTLAIDDDVLLDVNVLIALVDAAPIQHDAADDWFAAEGRHSWSTCPLTENGLLRIMGHARYPNSPGTPAAIATLLAGLRMLPGHHFWPDSISLLEAERIDAGRLMHATQVTDSYLLALAHANRGQLATFDRKLVVAAVHGGAKALHLI